MDKASGCTSLVSWREVHDTATNLGDDFEDEGRQRRERLGEAALEHSAFRSQRHRRNLQEGAATQLLQENSLREKAEVCLGPTKERKPDKVVECLSHHATVEWVSLETEWPGLLDLSRWVPGLGLEFGEESPCRT